MSFIEIVSAFSFYGLDVMLLATLTTIVVQILKKTLLKKVQKKVVTFLPFLFGTLFYAVYMGVYHLSIGYLAQNFVDVIEHGFAVGTASTLTYVFYEQFVRSDSGLSTLEGVIATLIEGYVPTDAVEDAAKQIAEAVSRDVTGNGAQKITEILTANAESDISERDITLLSKLIIETLAHLSSEN